MRKLLQLEKGSVISAFVYGDWSYDELIIWRKYLNAICVLSIKHCLDLVIECLIVEVVNFDGLEVFFRIKVSLSNEERLPEH
jgi:hypothetical protein